MKEFLPDDGLFELTIPIDWEYQLNEGYIHQFQFIEGVGTFHFSVLADEAKATFNKISKNPRVFRRKFGRIIGYEIPIENDQKFNALLWHIKLGVHYFLASYTYSITEKNSDKLQQELSVLYEILGSLKIVEPKERPQKIAWYKLGKFLQGVAASKELFQRAYKNGSFIECVCLLANQIDALLRIANILSEQIKNKDNTIDVTLVYQGVNDKPIFEKAIYKLSKDNGIIDQAIFDELYSIYNERNKVVHRYIISEITTEDVLEIALRYLKIREKIYAIVDQLERKQIELGLGMAGTQVDFDKDILEQEKEHFAAEIKAKHGGIGFMHAP